MAAGAEPSDPALLVPDWRFGYAYHPATRPPGHPATRPPGPRGDEIGRRQALSREVNERIEELSNRFGLDDRIPIICECANDGCHEQIELTQAEYERLRRVPTHFAVLPGHDIPAAERIVDRNSRYVTVETFGQSGITAIKLDPRRRRA